MYVMVKRLSFREGSFHESAEIPQVIKEGALTLRAKNGPIAENGPSPGPPHCPRHIPTVGFYEGGVSDERGTPVPASRLN